MAASVTSDRYKNDKEKVKEMKIRIVRWISCVALILCGALAAVTAQSLRANGKIAFTSDRDGNREIYVMRPDGTGQIRLTNNLRVDDHPTWSPDGTKIAFLCERLTGYGLCVMNEDGSNRVEITTIGSIFILPPNHFSDFFSLSWSPDGRRIAFQDNWDIYVVGADGSNRQRLTDAGGYDHEPAWSRDGSKILFSSARTRLYPSLYTMKPDGTDLQPFPGFDENWEIAPNWSPAGDKILFVVDYTDDISASDIRTVNSDGTNRQLFDGSGGNYTYRNKPSWSPDGTKIIFDKWEYSTGDMEIYVKNTDGSGYAQLTNTGGWNFHPSWQRLPRRILITIPTTGGRY